MKCNLWNAKEIETLVKMYVFDKYSMNDIKNSIPNRTTKAICKKAREIGLRRGSVERNKVKEYIKSIKGA